MSRPESARWFGWALAAVAGGALAIRLIYVFGFRQDHVFAGDAFFYHAGANLLADGKGFISPFEPHRAIQAGEHPPLYLIYLAIPSVLGFTSVLTHLVWSSLLGTATVVLVGLIGREVRGPRAGVIAAVVAAVYPNLWVPDGSLMAESMAMFATALAVYFAYRYWRDPRWWRLGLVGVASGAGALSRSELALIIPFMVIPLAITVGGITRGERWRGAGAAVCAALVVMAPWLVFNLTRFEKPELLSTQFGPLLSSANCDEVWRGATKSYFQIQCSIDIRDREIRGDPDESETDAIYRRAAFRYISHHKHLIPGVVAARLGAIVGLYQPTVQINLDSAIEGREIWLARLGLYSFWMLALASVFGAVVIRRTREVPVFPLLVPPVMVALTVMVTYASTRFRASAEIVVCVLAAVAVDSGVSRVRRSRENRAPSVDTTTPLP